MQDDKRDYCLLSGKKHFFEWPAGVVKPILNGCEDVFGCGLVLSADNKLAIFFTTNGILMGQLFHIHIRGIAKNTGQIIFTSFILLIFNTTCRHLGMKYFRAELMADFPKKIL
jgi:hypothetical protein